ncbi:MAG: ion transporter [Aliivibrio sp.]|uniref:potassium channel family protein n=1 Tax=Aliivibrio sp. TaxID=1872443 RepID=UPI001A525945|nr:ion transporter [Aliivibrio sp.]
MPTNSTRTDLKPMSLMSLFLSFISLIIISILLFAPINAESHQLLIGIDTLICSVFLFQLFLDLARSSNRVEYIKTHWIDFFASLPVIEIFRYARIFQIFRLIRILRSSKVILHQLKTYRRETTLASIFLIMVILITVGSGLMLMIESQHPDANIKDGGDALWWAFVTISTVGYGDHYPVSSSGKLLASVIIICGVGMFGMISGLISSVITEPKQNHINREKEQQRRLKQQQWDQMMDQQQQILQRLAAIEEKMDHKK